MDTKEVVFWSCGDGDDSLSHVDQYDAIEDFLDDIPVIEWPIELELFGYAPLKPDIEGLAKSTIDKLIEYIDEELGDPEEYSDTKCSDKMLKNAKKLVESIIEEYDNFVYEVVTKEVIKTEDYIKTNFTIEEELNHYLGKEINDLYKKFPGLKANKNG